MGLPLVQVQRPVRDPDSGPAAPEDVLGGGAEQLPVALDRVVPAQASDDELDARLRLRAAGPHLPAVLEVRHGLVPPAVGVLPRDHLAVLVEQLDGGQPFARRRRVRPGQAVDVLPEAAPHGRPFLQPENLYSWHARHHIHRLPFTRSVRLCETGDLPSETGVFSDLSHPSSAPELVDQEWSASRRRGGRGHSASVHSCTNVKARR